MHLSNPLSRFLPAVHRSIGVRLFASFALIILLCLFLAGSTFVYLLQPHETRQALNRLGNLALPLAVQVRILEAQGSSQNDIAEFLEEQARDLGVRILLIKESTRIVAYDTADTLNGTLLQFEGSRPSALSRVLEGVAEVPGEGSLAIVTVLPPAQGPLERPRRRFIPEGLQYTVALATPRAGLAAEWIQVAPRLGAAGAISLIASAAVAFLISRSISRPLADITRAAEGMARGDYNQRIGPHGPDEIGRLASTFNVMAEQVYTSHRTLRSFLADASHELRTPLTTIQGFSMAILDGTAADQEAVRESAEIIHQDALRMERMVEDLLYLSKIESGQIQLDRESVDLAVLIEGADKRARRRAEGHDVILEEVVPQPVTVNADPHRIEQVLDNLLSNAVNHTPAGGTITVTATSTNDEAIVRVHNTGSVVQPEDRERIFERFFHASGDGSGTGLGLAIADEIAKRHGGRIEVESAPARGTTFSLILPLRA